MKTLTVLMMTSIVALTPYEAFAKGKKRFGMRALNSSAVVDENVLSKRELKTCLIADKKLKSLKPEIDVSEFTLGETYRIYLNFRDDLDQRQIFLKENEHTNYTAQSDIDLYNRRVAEFNEKLKQMRIIGSDFKESEESFNTMVAEFNENARFYEDNCKDKEYRSKDYERLISKI